MNFLKGLKRENNEVPEAYKENTSSDFDYTRVINAAIEMFLKKEVPQFTFRDLSEDSGIEETLINKFFLTKSELMYAVAFHYLSPKYCIDEKCISESMTGLEAVNALFDEKVKLFIDYPERYRFMGIFEEYMMSERGLSLEATNEQKRYEQALRSTEMLWSVYLIAGINDKSIRSDVDIPLCIRTFSSILISYFQKTANFCFKTSTHEEDVIKDSIQVIKDMMYRYLKGTVRYQ